jgi:signal transduction histidine kinase
MAVVAAGGPRRRAGGDELAPELLERLLRVLGGLALAVGPPRGEEAAGTTCSGSPSEVAELLDGQSFETVADPGPAAVGATIERNRHGNLRIAVPLSDGDWKRGSLAVLLAPGRRADPRILRMVSVVAKMVALRIGASRPADGEPHSLRFSVARVLSDLGVAAESHEEMVAGITAAICPLVGAGNAGVGLWHESEAYVQMLPGSFGVPAEFVASSQAPRSHPYSRAARVVKTRQAYVTNDALTDMPEFREFLRGFGIERMVIVPLLVEDRLVGVAHIANKEGRFDAADVGRLEAVTPFVAAAVEHVHRRLKLRRKEALAVVVSRAATTIAAGEPLAGFSSSLSEFCEQVGGQLVVVSFADGSPQIVVGPGEVSTELVEEFRAASARGAFATRSAAKRPREVGDTGWDALHMPVLLAEKPEVTLSILRSPSEPFSDDEQAAVRRLGNITALAWATERYQQERARMARLRERERIADELHDRVAQILYGVKLTLEAAAESLDQGDVLLGPIDRACQLLARGEVEIREIIAHLSSGEELSMAAQLEAVVQSVEEDFEISIHLEIDAGAGSPDLSAAVVDAAVGAAREAMVNAAKHAGPCRVFVKLSLAEGGRLELRVVDDGVGWERETRPGYGLEALRRRLRVYGAEVRFGRGAYGGAEVAVLLPVGS